MDHGHGGMAGDGRRIRYSDIDQRPNHFAGFAVNTGSQTVGSSASTTGVTLQTVDVTDQDLAAPNGFRIKESGFWNVFGMVRVATNGTAGQRNAWIMVNGAERVGTLAQLPASGTDVSIPVSACLRLVAGDVVTLGLFQQSGGNVTVVSSTNCTSLSISKA